MTTKGASVLIDTLNQCKSIVSKLELERCQIDDECLKQLCEFVQNNEHLEELSLGYNLITDKGMEMLSESLIGNIKLKVLGIEYNNKITDASAPHLVEIAKKSCIKEIKLYGISLSPNNKQGIELKLKIPTDRREVPIKSNTKSAAKISYGSSSSSYTE